MFTRIHHLGLVSDDLDDVNILDIPVGESELEVNLANDSNSGTARFLASRGPGPHHVCLDSNDIDADAKRLSDGGFQVIVPPRGSREQQGGSRVAFFQSRGNLGFLLGCGRTWRQVGASKAGSGG